LLWYRHLNLVNISIRSKYVIFVKKYTLIITAKNLILSLFTFAGFNKQKNPLNLGFAA